MQRCDGITNDARCFLISSVAGELREASLPLRPFKQDGIALDGQNQRCALTSPPRHQQAAEFFLGFSGNFQHRRHAIPAHRQELRAPRDDRIAVGDQMPSVYVVLKQ